jgi:hypothetical protein
VSTHVVIESRWPRSSPSLTPVKSTARARAPISTTSRFAGPQGALGTVSRRSPTWSSGIAGDVRRAEFAVTAAPVKNPALAPLCANALCSTHARPPAAELSVSPREPRTPHRREGTGRGRWPGCPRRFATGLRCFASLGLDRKSHHTSPTPSRPGNCFENLRGRRPLSNYAGTALAGRHRHLNRARRGIRSANLDRQKYRPEGGATWL